MEKYVLAIIGHRNLLGAETSYLHWKKIESESVRTCADKMCFLDTGAVVKAEKWALERQNGKLESLLER